MRGYRQFAILLVSTHLALSVWVAGQARTNRHAANAVVDFGFDSASDGWAVVWKETDTSLFRTDDAGKTWHPQKAPPGITKAYFLNPAVGWAVTQEVGEWWLNRTKDGGQNWSRISRLPLPNHGAADVVLDLRFRDDRNGWLLVQTGQAQGIVVLRLVGGESIQSEQTIPEPRFMSGFGAPNGTFWLVGMDNQIVEIQGSRWELKQAAHFGPAANWFRGLMLTGKTGFIVGQGGAGTILKTEDGGKDWHAVFASKSVAALFDISFFNSTSGCAVGDSRSLYCTNDGGDHWSELPTLPSISESGQGEEFVRVLFLNRDRAYVIRDGGFIYETSDGGKTWNDRQTLFR